MFHSCIEFSRQMKGRIGGICVKIDEMVFDNNNKELKVSKCHDKVEFIEGMSRKQVDTNVDFMFCY